MKRLVLVSMLLIGGAVSAHADTDTWSNTRKYQRNPLHASAHYCTRTVGPNLNGMPTPRIYKRCMAGLGWRYVRTIREYPYYRGYSYGYPYRRGWYYS